MLRVRWFSSMSVGGGEGGGCFGWGGRCLYRARSTGFQLKVAAGEQRRPRRGQLCNDGGGSGAKTISCTHRLCFCACVRVCIRQIINRRGRSCSNYTSEQFVPPLPCRVCWFRSCAQTDGVAVAAAVVRLIFQRRAHATLDFRKFPLANLFILTSINRILLHNIIISRVCEREGDDDIMI